MRASSQPPSRAPIWPLLVLACAPQGDCYGEAPAPASARPAAEDHRAACVRRHQDAPPRYRAIARALCADHHNLGGVGVSVAIAEAGKIRWLAVAGRTCVRGAKITPHTVFRAGSLTKLATAALALTLVDEGLLGLDAPLWPHLPELAEAVDPDAAAITLRHLLAHSAGLPDRAPTGAELRQAAAGASPSAPTWLHQLGGFPLWAPPGALWSYSNAGYAAVGLAVERVSGEPYARALATRLFAPLRLHEIGADLDEARAIDWACGRLGPGSAAREIDLAADRHLRPSRLWTAPAGGLFASASALVELLLGLGDPAGSPLSEAARDALLAPAIATHERPGETYALGLRRRLLSDGAALYAHSGNTGDYAAELYWIPATGFAAVIMSGSGEPLRATALAIQRELFEPPPPPAPAAPLAHYTGDYWPPEWPEPLRVRLVGAALHLSGPLFTGPTPLEHLGDHRFRVRGRPELGALTFVWSGAQVRPLHLRARLFSAERVDRE
ncbi:MAG: beta-lactamase family protein [Nannocystis sp.]|nr:beta-lactamase family protein [Nannocystis sp.]